MINFPSNPVDQQQYSNDGRSWKYSSATTTWDLVPVSTADADIAAAAALKAKDWATKLGDPVEDGLYSARQYAINANGGGEGGGEVFSVAGRTGAVVLTAADVGLVNVNNTSDASKPVSTAVQAALDLKAPIASPTFTGTVAGITKTMVGLGAVDNTADVSKPVSTAAQTALDLKAPLASPTFTGTVAGVTASMVGLGNVTNTSDANKPVSTAQQTALDAKAPLANPTFTGTVAGVTKAHVGLGNVDNTADTAKPVSTAQQTALDLKANLASPTFTGTVAGITKTMVGLGSVDNTTDAGKPVSTAQQTALDLKAPLASPALTGNPTAPTASVGDADTSIATTAFVQAAKAAAVQAVTSSATVTPTFGNDLVKITAQAAGLTIANPTGTAIDGHGLVVRVKDNGTARTVAFGSQYRAVGVTLPTTTVVNKTLYLGMVWNVEDTKFDVVAVAQEA